MKKSIIIFAAIILLLFSGCSNQFNKFSIEMLPNNIEQVKVSHYLSGEVSEWVIEGNELENWKSWLSELTARQKDFEEGSTPGDVEGGESYSFTINNEESSVSYIINGDDCDCYLIFAKEWYVVSNPTDPF